MRRSCTPILMLVATSLALTGCAASAHGENIAHDWAAAAACPTPATIAKITGLSPVTFAKEMSHEHGAASTGCTYQTGSGGTQISIVVQPGPPTSVTYNTAAGVTNTAEPSLGSGAHQGTSSFFCGLAVPATDNRTLSLTILPPAGSRADCTHLAALLKDVATRSG